MLAVALALSAGHLAAQGRSATMSVSVRVVRPCSVSAPSSVSATSSAPREAAGLEVAVACGSDPASVPLTPGAGVLRMAGARAAAVVSTSRDATGTVRVAVDF